VRYRPTGADPEERRFGRYVPDDWRHVDNYPLTALLAPERPVCTPVVIGVNWYAEMDQRVVDERSGETFIARSGAESLTRIRGGHCVCLEPGGEPDTAAEHEFYDQGAEGACVGFGWSRCMTLLNGGRYAARWLWDRSKERDEWPQTNPGDDQGTSVRAAAEVLISAGHVQWDDALTGHDHVARATYRADADQGISAYRWARSVDEVHAVLDNTRADELGAVPILNSWGPEYPHRVWLPDDVFARLIEEDGEVAVPTDR
jgi:hypothetical protein